MKEKEIMEVAPSATCLEIGLPGWTAEYWPAAGPPFAGFEERMRFVLGLARRNVEEGTGGPFAAAVFDAEGRLVAPGVNMVVPAGCSILHAEVVALALAQKRLGRHVLGAGGSLIYELVTAAEPCVMCFGAVLWAGISRLVCGARSVDAGAIGFDEGPKPPFWERELQTRGIEVVRDVLRVEAVEVLRRYAAKGGEIYSPVRRIPAGLAG